MEIVIDWLLSVITIVAGFGALGLGWEERYAPPVFAGIVIILLALIKIALLIGVRITFGSE